MNFSGHSPGSDGPPGIGSLLLGYIAAASGVAALFFLRF